MIALDARHTFTGRKPPPRTQLWRHQHSESSKGLTATHDSREPSEEMVPRPAPSLLGNLEDLGQFAGRPRFAGRPAEPSRWTDPPEVAGRHLRADRQRRLWQRLPRTRRNL